MFIATFRCPKGILGLGGGAFKNKLKDTSFIFQMTNVTILGVYFVRMRKSARLHGIVNGESLRNVFCCLLCIFYCQTTPILKTFGQFENLVFVIMPYR